jgi:exodeoxyribonuclease VII large subunit
MINSKIINVTTLNNYIKNVFEGDVFLSRIYIKGEISNLNKHYTGLYYFTLKDENSKISCMMFSFNVNKLKGDIKNGDEVLIKGYVSVYEKNGSYQLYVQDMEPYGKGKELLKLEELKKKLKEEGIFDLEKKELPKYPKKIGLVTSKSGAAVKDLIHSINSRYNPQIYIFPCLVQGENAPKSILNSLKLALNYNLDIVIIARGGGANEDLSAFNDEELVRYVSSYPLPTIGAIGHQIDSSLLDLVVSYSCITPTEAGVKAVPDKDELIDYLRSKQLYLNSLINRKIDLYTKRLLYINASKGLLSPLDKYLSKIKDIEKYKLAIDHHINDKIKNYVNKLDNFYSKLNALNPYQLLNRGYSLMYKDKNIVTSIDQLKIGDSISINLKDGEIISTVDQIKKG